MFAEVHPVVSKRQSLCLALSLTLHVLCLGWLLHNPAPIFVAPAAVTKGDGGSAVTRIYFGGSAGVKQEKSTSHLILPKSAKQEKGRRLAPLPAKSNAGNVTTAAARPEDAPGGSPYGSLSYGAIFGLEVRPALPVVSIDPVVGADLLNGTAGDVIIEITIDRDGNITEMKVLQSMGPLVDQRVLTALEKWHFAPATRNGTPIPSKQDVHYHFPR
jgi:periplasmic protein TonB